MLEKKVERIQVGPTASEVAAWVKGLGGSDEAEVVLSRFLVSAARKGAVGLIKELLALGANPQRAQHPDQGLDLATLSDGSDFDWVTPWSAAVASGSAHALGAMFEAGVDPCSAKVVLENWVDDRFSPLGLAARLGRVECFELALGKALGGRGVEEDQKVFRDVFTNLSHAVAGIDDMEKMLRIMMSRGADVDVDVDAMSPLVLAAMNNPTMLEALLGLGADANAPGAVVAAIGRHGPHGLRLLLAAGADPNQKGPGGTPAMFKAAQAGDVLSLEALLDAGARVESHDEKGLSALMRAVGASSPDGVALLLSRGADPDAPMPGGELLSTWARAPRTMDRASSECARLVVAASDALALRAACCEAPRKGVAPRL
jgi:hypothetical protein